MNLLNKGIKRILLIMMSVAVFVTMTLATAFAAEFKTQSDGSVNDIYVYATDSSISIPSGTTSVKSGAAHGFMGWNNSSVKTVNIPSSVTKIESGAFTKCTGIKNVYVDNCPSKIEIASGAFPSGAVITYGKEDPTTTTTAAVTTTKKAVTTTKQSTTATTAKKTTAASNVTKKATTTAKSSTKNTTAATTVATVGEIGEAYSSVNINDDSVALNSSSDSDDEWWNSLVEAATAEPESTTSESSQKKSSSFGAAGILSTAAVIGVAFSAVYLGYVKFRR